MKKLLSASIFIVAILQLSPATVFAQSDTQTQQSQALSVSPAVLEEIIDPGGKIEDVITLTNTTNVPIPIKAWVSNFTPKEDLLYDPQGIFKAQGWFKLDQPDLILQAHESRKIKVTISPPANASPGGHYATIYFQSLIAAEDASSERLYLTGRVGVLSFVIVKGDIVEKASIKRLSTTQKYQTGKSTTFKLGLKSEGNVHVLPNGDMYIYDWRDKEVARIPLKPGFVLPQTTRVFEETWNNKGKLGKYRAVAKLQYGSKRQEVNSSSVFFYVLPSFVNLFKWLLLLIVVAFVLWKRKRLAPAFRTLLGRDNTSK